MKLLAATLVGVSCSLLTACGPSEQKRAELAEKRRIECLDTFCEGDVEPLRDKVREVALKINGQWYVGPTEYFARRSGAVFYWPGRQPAYSPGDFPPGVKGRDFYDVAIEVFLRSNNIPPEPRGYKLIELAEANGWIADRRQIKPGLEAIRMKHVQGPDGYYIDHLTYYVATDLKGSDGLPPVAGCNHDQKSYGGGTGFMWQPGIWAGVRMNQRHCVDWPEIYSEVTRVLQLLRRA
ncbi:MAG: hypothetical protein AB7S86_07800 [Hydrogenophaga sp.]|uniref:hypothetical protein n=1 Tax=Hydrogenophaga sp. TaxID=1904254 RepID=UPI003D130793